MINEWTSKMSNDVLEACFIKDKKPFGAIFNELKTTGSVKDKQKHVMFEDVKVLRN
jgi:hypothetical protein